MKQYLKIVNEILTDGVLSQNRTGVPSLSLFGRNYTYDLGESFPILTTRYQPFDKILAETLWYLSGDENCDYLDEKDVKVWKAWTDETTNSVGPLYPTQLRHYPSYRQAISPKARDYLLTLGYKNIASNLYYKEIDQLARVFNELKSNKNSRRHIVDFYNPTYLPSLDYSPKENVSLGNMALEPCGVLYQFQVQEEPMSFYIHKDLNAPVVETLIKEIHRDNPKVKLKDSTELYRYLRKHFFHYELDFKNRFKYKDSLSLLVFQRSWDVGAAGGWNISQYSLIALTMAKLLNYLPKTLQHSVGNLHIYKNQIPALSEQIIRTPYPLPKLNITLKEGVNLDNLKTHVNYQLINYQYHPGKTHIPVSV